MHTSITQSIPSSLSFSSFPTFSSFYILSKSSTNELLPNIKHTKGRQMGTTLLCSKLFMAAFHRSGLCIGLLASDLWIQISFLKQRLHTDELFFILQFLSLPPASILLSVYCRWVIYQVHCEEFIRCVWESTYVTQWAYEEIQRIDSAWIRNISLLI